MRDSHTTRTNSIGWPGETLATPECLTFVHRRRAQPNLSRGGAHSPRRRQTVKQVARVVQPIAQASDVKVRTEIAEDLPPLQGDRHLIEGALLNLVSNAIKYCARGSEVKVGTKVGEDGIVLEVWNPGPAIAAEELGRLFEPFYRRSEQEQTQRGWGLGLAFVKRIAEQHGGKVEAWSKSGAGTSFRIHLPTTRLVLSEAHQ